MDQVVCVARIDEPVAVDDGFVPAHRHERAVQVEDAFVRVRIALAEVQGDDGLSREDHPQIIQRQAVGAGGLHVGIILEGVLADEDDAVVQDYVSALHMNRLGKVVDLLVMDLAVYGIVGVDLFLAVRNDVGDDDLVVDDEAHVAGEYLVAVLHQLGAIDFDAVFEKHGLESVHLPGNILLFGIDALEDGFVRLGVEGFTKFGDGTVAVGESENDFTQASGF